MVDIVDLGVVVAVDIVAELVNGVSREREKLRILVDHLQNFSFTFFHQFSSPACSFKRFDKNRIIKRGYTHKCSYKQTHFGAHTVMHFI